MSTIFLRKCTRTEESSEQARRTGAYKAICVPSILRHGWQQNSVSLLWDTLVWKTLITKCWHLQECRIARWGVLFQVAKVWGLSVLIKQQKSVSLQHTTRTKQWEVLVLFYELLIWRKFFKTARTPNEITAILEK